MKYRKKPMVVEANQFKKRGECPIGLRTREDGRHYVLTAQGQEVTVEEGEYVILEDPPGDGTRAYPCKADVFERTYEPEISGNDIADQIEAERPDWRIGLSAKPKFRQHEMYYEPPAIIVAVHPSGFGGKFCKDGILVLEGRFGVRFLAPAEEWVTA
jgi:hypothetical protein